jgi:prepilin-type N-terminal cleavage/methylation domain-containing protein
MKFEARILNCLKQKIKFIIHHSPPAIAFAKRWRAGSFIIHPEHGFTLVEILVVVGIIGLMSTVSIAILNPTQQLQKSRDTQRKSDLKQIQNALEAYSFDTGRYPAATEIVWGADWSPYLPTVPKDPLSPNQEYSYELIDNNTYRLFAKLERCSDPQVNVIGDCKASQFNFSATSSNIASSFIGTASGPIPTPTSAPTPTSVILPTPTPTNVPIPTSTPVNTPTPTVGIGGGLGQEAENANVSGMTIANDSNASASRYVWIPQGAGGNGNDATSGGPEFVEFTFNIPSAKTYGIWARTIAPDGSSDSFYVMLDGALINEWHVPQSTNWRWNKITNRSLNSGIRKIAFRKREDGTRLDRVLLAENTNCVPTGNSGDNCLPSTPIPTPTNVPIPTSAPTNTPPIPTATPVVSYKRVFITSTTYNGNLGGLSGADAKCQERANAASLGGTWKAWLSDSTSSPSTRFTKATGYKLLSGTVVAYSWTDLTDGILVAGIKSTEFNSAPSIPFETWTNTQIDGRAHLFHCTRWGTSSSNGSGLQGTSFPDSLATNNSWTLNGTTQCDVLRRLYCFEQ